MLCIRPFKPRKGVEFGCGQCLPCRINRRRVWTARIVLESMCHPPSMFFTLTYSPELVPRDGSLVPSHLDEFRRSLRYQIGPFRYWFVGEYGEVSWRPHYHGVVFGHVLDRDSLAEIWGRGFAHVGLCTVDSAAYIAGYVTKKMTSADHVLLNGRHPEFTRQSLKPGIGAPALEAILNWLFSEEGAKYVGRNSDVPLSVRFNGKIFPLGRYLVSKLREAMDMPASDPGRQAKLAERALDLAVPEMMEKRELLREGQYRKAKAYLKLRKSVVKI
ncbi:MAG: replication initiator protein [Microviridae sp.]|nr:MAG: replication initiator protein [Microviridae sp.]